MCKYCIWWEGIKIEKVKSVVHFQKFECMRIMDCEIIEENVQ